MKLFINDVQSAGILLARIRLNLITPVAPIILITKRSNHPPCVRNFIQKNCLGTEPGIDSAGPENGKTGRKSLSLLKESDFLFPFSARSRFFAREHMASGLAFETPLIPHMAD